jgi:hypothetical protein
MMDVNSNLGTDNEEIMVLVGNGLSIAFNEDMKVSNITKDFEKVFGEGNLEMCNVLLGSIDKENSRLKEDFESLVGSIYSFEYNVAEFKRINESSKLESDGIGESLDKMIDYFEMLVRYAKWNILEIIRKKTANENKDFDNFIESLIKKFNGFHVTFANLNYDAMIYRSLTRRYSGEFYDLAYGDIKGSKKFKLREDIESFDKVKEKKICLLHLHGCLNFVEEIVSNEENGVAESWQYKLVLDLLDNSGVFGSELQIRDKYKPLVVLNSAENKHNDIAKNPYKLAYEYFDKKLQLSNKLLILGYSFRDHVVNKRLHDAFYRNIKLKQILIVNYIDGKFEKNDYKRIVNKAFCIKQNTGYESNNMDRSNIIKFNFDGAKEFLNSDDWKEFCSF